MYGRSIASRIVAHDSARVEATHPDGRSILLCSGVAYAERLGPRDLPFTVFDIDTDSEHSDVDET